MLREAATEHDTLLRGLSERHNSNELSTRNFSAKNSPDTLPESPDTTMKAFWSIDWSNIFSTQHMLCSDSFTHQLLPIQSPLLPMKCLPSSATPTLLPISLPECLNWSRLLIMTLFISRSTRATG